MFHILLLTTHAQSLTNEMYFLPKIAELELLLACHQYTVHETVCCELNDALKDCGKLPQVSTLG